MEKCCNRELQSIGKTVKTDFVRERWLYACPVCGRVYCDPSTFRPRREGNSPKIYSINQK